MDAIRTKRLELEAMICQNMESREMRVTLRLLLEYEKMLVKNCNTTAVSKSVSLEGRELLLAFHKFQQKMWSNPNAEISENVVDVFLSQQ